MKFLPIASCTIDLSSHSGATGEVFPGHQWDCRKGECTTESDSGSWVPGVATLSKPEVREERAGIAACARQGRAGPFETQ